MKILVTGHAGYSHLVPFLLPAASALQSAGHTITVAVPAGGADIVSDYGLDVLAVEGVPSLEEITRDSALLAESFSVTDYEPGEQLAEIPPVNSLATARAFVGVIGYRMATGLRAALDSAVPDLMVCDNSEIGGRLLAELLDCPQLNLDVVPTIDESNPGPEVAEVLMQVRDALGLKPFSPLPVRPRVAQNPIDFYPVDRVPDRLHCFRPARRSHAPLDPVIAELPADRPLVLATLGSISPTVGIGLPVLQGIIDALALLDVYAVVAVGSQKIDNVPPNVTLTEFVDQQTLLPYCDVFISHGGFNGVRESLQSGVPMVLLPLFGDHPANAAQAERLGAGIVLETETVGADEIAAATKTILDDPGYRARARRFARRSLALPELTTLPDRLTEILA